MFKEDIEEQEQEQEQGLERMRKHLVKRSLSERVREFESEKAKTKEGRLRQSLIR